MDASTCLWYEETRFGRIGIREQADSIVRLYLRGEIAEKGVCQWRSALLADAFRQLREYFDGFRTRFDLPLAPQGTAFMRSVWNALCTIPYGQTVSYREVAAQIGNPRAVRAVGMANHRNPIPILIPCHRVIGSHGDLVGYAGGLDLKAALLKLELCGLRNR